MKQKWVKRIARAMLPCFVFFVFSFSFAPKAHAANFDGNFYYGFKSWTSNAEYGTTGKFPLVNGVYTHSSGVIGKYSPYFRTDATTLFEGQTKLYLSYYFKQGNENATVVPTCDQSSFTVPSKYNVTYVNTNGQTGSVLGGLEAVSIFTPNDTMVISNQGYAIEALWEGSEGLPIRALAVTFTNANAASLTNSNGKGFVPIIKVPSARLIITQTSGELEALDNVASEIAAQSDILLAMKGDLVAILQDIYTMTGDIYIAQNLLNGYVQQMLPLLQNIDQTTTDIYSLLSTQLRLLETAIENAADSIEAAISAQTAAMIAYLDSVLNTGNEVPDDTYQQQQDAVNILDQMESLEKPNVDTIVPEIGDYSDSGVSGVLSAIFSSNLIVTMMTLSASFAFGAYVLFGKRE